MTMTDPTTTDPTATVAAADNTPATATQPAAPPATPTDNAPPTNPTGGPTADPTAELRAQLADAHARLAVFTQRQEIETLLRAARARNVPELTDAAVNLLRTSPGISLPTAVRALAARHAHLFPASSHVGATTSPLAPSSPASPARVLGLDAPTLRAAARGDLRALLAMFSARRRSAAER